MPEDSNSSNNEKNNWTSYNARLRSEARSLLGNSRDGAAIVFSIILMDNHGNPITWIVPNGLVLEPKRTAMDVLLKYFMRK